MGKRRSWLIFWTAVLLLGALTATVTFANGASQALPGPAASLAATSKADGATTHVVKWGETLALIARRYGVSVRELAAYNRIPNPDRIYAGQVLRRLPCRPVPRLCRSAMP
jgi:nucleoid-associated protein YgaU